MVWVGGGLTPVVEVDLLPGGEVIHQRTWGGKVRSYSSLEPAQGGSFSLQAAQLTSDESDSGNVISQQPQQEENLPPADANRCGAYSCREQSAPTLPSQQTYWEHLS